MITVGILTPGRDGTESAVYCLLSDWPYCFAAFSLRRVVMPKQLPKVVAPKQLSKVVVMPKQLPRVVTLRDPPKHPPRAVAPKHHLPWAVIPKLLSRVAAPMHQVRM